MARAATVEFDFLGLEGKTSAPSVDPRSINSGGVVRDALRWVATTSRFEIPFEVSAASGWTTAPSSTTGINMALPLSRQPTTIISPAGSSSAEGSGIGTAPLTIFYKGKVAVFDLTSDKAEAIIMQAAAEADGAASDSGGYYIRKFRTFLGDFFPVARTRSLRRFLARRKQRMIASGPYDKNYADGL